MNKTPWLLFATSLVLSCTAAKDDTSSSSDDALDESSDPKGDRDREVPNDWFILQRAYPAADLDQRARLDAFQSGKDFIAARSDDSAPVWTFAGPDNVGGRITDVESHPAVPGLVYVATASGGVFRSTDDGATFQAIFDAQPSLSIGDIGLDPNDPNVVWVGTGESNSAGDTYPGSGVYLSLDRGSTWQAMGLADTQQIGRVVVDPSDGNTVWVAALGNMRTDDDNRGVYRTKDKGKTWQKVLFASNHAGAVDLALDPSSPSTIYASIWDRPHDPKNSVGGKDSGLFKSTDGGATWSELETGLPAASDTRGRIGVSVCASQPKTLYAIFDDTKSGFSGVYRSDDGGTSFARTSDSAIHGIYADYGWWFGNVRCSPKDPNVAYTLGLYVAKTSDGGRTWHKANGKMHPDQHALYIDPANPSHVLVGNDGGFWVSRNAGKTYSGPARLPVTQFYDISFDPSHPERIYGGAQDNGVMRTMTGGTSDWQMFYGGDGFFTFVDPTDSNVVYAESQNGYLGKSTDGAQNFATIAPQAARTNWNTPVGLDPNDHDILYYAGEKLYRSTDAGQSFAAISQDLTGGQNPKATGSGTISTYDVARSDSRTIYVGTDDGNVWVTRDLGAHWTEINHGLPVHYVTRVLADSQNPARVFVTLSGYGTDGHIFQSDDAGATWHAIDVGLPQLPVNVILEDPASATTLYVGNDIGVFVTRDLGKTWAPLGTGMPLVPVLDLALDAQHRRLIAGTHGRSMYALKL